jgi:hypothetical protein
MGAIKAIWQFLWKNRKWVIQIIFVLYDIIRKQIKKRHDKGEPVAGDKVHGQQEEQAEASKEAGTPVQQKK